MLFIEVIMNDHSFQILDNLIAKTINSEKLHKYYSNRAFVDFQMKEWKGNFLRLRTAQTHSLHLEVLKDVEQIGKHGQVDGNILLLKL